MTRLAVSLVTTVLVSGGLGLAGLGLTAGVAQAAGWCNHQQMGCWCPGNPLPPSSGPIDWDMSVCQAWFYSQRVGQRDAHNPQLGVGIAFPPGRCPSIFSDNFDGVPC
jgi:hypothetical protein